jgi:hypothetical protein
MVGIVAETSIELSSLNPTISASLVALGGLAVASKYIRAPRDRRQGERRFNWDAQAAVGEHYELYRTHVTVRSAKHPISNQNAVVMHWHAPYISPETPSRGDDLEHITHAAQLAKQAGVNKIAVNEAVARPVLPDLAQPTEALRDIFRKKSLRLGGNILKTDMHVKTPDEWLELARDKRTREGYPLNVLLSKIEAYQPSHPLAVINRDLAGYPDQRKTRLLHMARVGVERQLDDVQPGRSALGIPERHHVRGMLDTKGNVHQFNNGKYGATTTLDRALGKTDEQLLFAIENGDNDPQGAVRALEVLTYKKLKEKQIIAKDGEDKPKDQRERPDSNSHQLQFFKKNMKLTAEQRISRKLRRTARVVGFIASAAAMSGVTFIAMDKTSVAYTKDFMATQDAIQKERGKDADVQYDDPEIDARIGQWRLWQKATTAISDGALFIDYGPARWGSNWHNYPIPKNNLNFDMAQNMGADTRMGNVKRDDNKVDWDIHENGMSGAGYWAVNVNDQLDVLDPVGDDGLSINWSRSAAADFDNTFLKLPAIVPANTEKYLNVSRNLALGDMIYNNYTQLYSVAMPVLDGTRPVAASLNGKPIEIAVRQDGTYYMAIKNRTIVSAGSGGQFSYSLAPTEDVPTAHRERPLFLSSYSGDIRDILDEAGINAAWEKIIPGLPKSTGDQSVDAKRSLMIAQYIDGHWQYRTTPWKDGALKGVHDMPQEIIRMDEIAKANCNVANGDISIENPDYAPVTGYRNGGDTTKISSHESHQWAEDKQGGKAGRIDATPTQGLTAEDEKFFAEDYNKKPEERNKGWLYVQLGVIAAGLALWRRRDAVAVARGVQAGVTVASEQSLSRMPADKLRLATNLAEQAAYAPKVQVPVARARAERNTSTKSELANRLVRPSAGLHTRETSKALRQAARQANSRGDKHALRQAARLISRARHIASLKARRAQK